VQRLLLLAQVFITDVRATKKQIKNAVLRLYDIQTKRINTLVRCPGCAAATPLELPAPDAFPVGTGAL
jgi:hypothetical protein